MIDPVMLVRVKQFIDFLPLFSTRQTYQRPGSGDFSEFFLLDIVTYIYILPLCSLLCSVCVNNGSKVF